MPQRSVQLDTTTVPILQRPWLVRPGRMGAAISLFLAFLCYPFTHLYGYHSAIGNLPRFMDGIFGMIGIIGTVLLFLLFLVGDLRRLSRSSAAVTFIFCLFAAYAFTVVLIHYYLAGGAAGSHILLSYYGRILLNYLLLFMVGFYIRPEQGRWFFTLAFVLICINIAFHLNMDRMMIDLRHVVDPAYRGIYLGLSTTALFTGLLAWAAVKRPFARLAILGVMIPLLFFTGSRADFASFIIILPFALYLTLRPVWQVIVYGLAALFLLIGLAVAGFESLASSRHFQFFVPEQFTSLMARSRLLAWGMERVATSPIFGDYGGTLAEIGTTGSYIHNLLSVWQAFGLLPFLFYAGLTAIVVYLAFRLMIKKGRSLDGHEQLVVLLSLLVAVQVVSAKSLGWSHVALAWGMMAGLMQRGLHTNFKYFNKAEKHL